MTTARVIDSRHMRDNFSTQACHYDDYTSVQKRVVERLKALWPADLSADGPVLDIGAGTGALAGALSQLDPGRQLVIMDIAHGMTLQAAARLPRACACDGDAGQLPFRSATFAGVASGSVYQWVEDLPAAFTEVARVLRPGGCFVMALFGERTLQELRTAHRQAVLRCNRPQLSHVHSFPTLNDVSIALAAARLRCCEQSSTMEVEYHQDVSGLLRQLKRIGAGNATLGRPRGLASRRVMQGMMDYYETTYRGVAGLPASYEVIVVLARKNRD